MAQEGADSEFVILDDDPGTEFVIVEDESPDPVAPRDDELVAVPDSNTQYPELVPVESLTETGFVIVEEERPEETGFVIVGDGRDDVGIVPVEDADASLDTPPDAGR